MSKEAADHRIGKRLKELRAARGLTQREVAQAVGVDVNAVSRIETGKHGVSLPTARKVAAALEVPLRDLLGDEPAAGPGRLERPANVGAFKRFMESSGRALRPPVSDEEREYLLSAPFHRVTPGASNGA